MSSTLPQVAGSRVMQETGHRWNRFSRWLTIPLPYNAGPQYIDDNTMAESRCRNLTLIHHPFIPSEIIGVSYVVFEHQFDGRIPLEPPRPILIQEGVERDYERYGRVALAHNEMHIAQVRCTHALARQFVEGIHEPIPADVWRSVLATLGRNSS